MWNELALRPTATLVDPPAPAELVTSAAVNGSLWRRDHVGRYAHRVLRPAEIVLLARYREALAGRVLEIGCGAGRILGYLVELGGEVHGIDVSPAMLDYCRRTYPEAQVQLSDMRAVATAVEGQFDAVVAPDNILDVVEPDERQLTLAAIRTLLTPDGVLIFSAHNLASVDDADTAAPSHGRAGQIVRRLAHLTPAQAAGAVVRLPRRVRNRRRLVPLQRRAGDHAVLNDVEGDYGALHYYVRRDDQARQLDEAGFELIECRDADGREVPAGAEGAGPSLHYVARAA